MLFFFKKFSGISLSRYIRNILPQIISCCVMYLIVSFFRDIIFNGEASLLGFVMQIIAGVVSYALFMIIFFKGKIIEAKKVFQP